MKEGTMKHPFKTGDLVRSRYNRTNFAIVTKAHRSRKDLFIDVVWLRTGKQVSWYCFSRFTLLSRAEQ